VLVVEVLINQAHRPKAGARERAVPPRVPFHGLASAVSGKAIRFHDQTRRAPHSLPSPLL
jgi:hypothetical protein